MRKTVYVILASCLLLGLVLMVLDGLTQSVSPGMGDFNVPKGFESFLVDLNEKTRTDELLFTGELEWPSYLDLFFQSDAAGIKHVTVVSESDILGAIDRRMSFAVGTFTGKASSSPSLLMDAGKYSVYLTSEQTEGKIVIARRSTAVDVSEFERLSKIHKGDLDNPPEGYERIYSADLSEKACREETIYTLSLDRAESIGLSIYTSARQGIVSVDFVGENMYYYNLVNPVSNRICDRLELILPAGDYKLNLTCEDARGELVVFVRR